MQTLADKLRPDSIDNIVGQEHLLGKDKPLRRLIETNNIQNIILYGCPGCGKTTLARILSKNSGKNLFSLNGTTASVKDIQDIAKQLDTLEYYNGIVLFIDEIHALNKQRQAAILSYIEDGRITLIASTTENPFHSINGAILSRCMLFELKSIEPNAIAERLSQCIPSLAHNITFDNEALELISELSNGDMRKAITFVDTILKMNSNLDTIHICTNSVKNLLQENMFMDTSKYYDWISMLHKSIRGSSPDASLIALSTLLQSGFMDAVCRRLLVIGAEDISINGYPIYPTLFSLVSAAKMVGMPEAQIILSNAVILLATYPGKSNSSYLAIKKAMHDVSTLNVGDIQPYLKDNHYNISKKSGTQNYLYPHDYPNHYVEQEYMPSNLIGKQYYSPCSNKYEDAIKNYWNNIKK